MKNKALLFRCVISLTLVVIVFGALALLSLPLANAKDLAESASETSREPASSLETKKDTANQMSRENEEAPTRLFTPNWRKSMTESGLDWDAFYFWNGISNQSGGAKKGAIGLSTFDLLMHFDLEKMVNWKGSSFHLHHHTNGGKFVGDYVGDVMGSNSYSLSEEDSFLSQIYLKQAWGEGAFDAAIGVYDFSSEFFITDSSLIFLNNGFLLGAEMYPPGPAGLSIYPVNSPSLRFRWAMDKVAYVLAGIASATVRDPNYTNGLHSRVGKDEGYYQVLEAGLQSEFETGVYQKFSVGAWSFTNDFDKLNGSGAKAKDAGFYGMVDFHFTSSTSGFARFGQANKDLMPIESTMSVGLNHTGIFTDKDTVGVGYAQSMLGLVFRDMEELGGNSLESSESAIELVYRIEPMPGFTIMPDLQKIRNPSMSKVIKEATVASLRLELSF